MRIIAGEFRGRRLLPPAGDQTRPVTDRVKQSIFDILAPRIEGATVYDCFSGTGSFGLESLSRGARHATFFESHRPTAAVLRQNIQTLGVSLRSTIVTSDWFSHVVGATSQSGTDLIFLDPPYRFLSERADDLRTAVAALVERHLAPGGLICFRHDAADSLDLPAAVVVDSRSYGSMAVELLASPARDHR
jgi:16S rRNA (guanine966-N2)-methyltransferase